MGLFGGGKPLTATPAQKPGTRLTTTFKFGSEPVVMSTPPSQIDLDLANAKQQLADTLAALGNTKSAIDTKQKKKGQAINAAASSQSGYRSTLLTDAQSMFSTILGGAGGISKTLLGS